MLDNIAIYVGNTTLKARLQLKKFLKQRGDLVCDSLIFTNDSTYDYFVRGGKHDTWCGKKGSGVNTNYRIVNMREYINKHSAWFKNL